MPHPDFRWQESDDRCVIDAPGGQLVFVRAGDRWRHEVSFRSEESAALVSTVEADTSSGVSDPSRVASPVYQELHRHAFAGDQFRGICVLLTGRMHQHHFSASVSVFREPDAERSIAVEIDVADRCRGPVSALAATYLVRLGSNELADAGPCAITWSGGSDEAIARPARMELRCDPPASVVLAEAGRNAARVQVLAAVEPDRFTHRLRYRWRWTADGSR